MLADQQPFRVAPYGFRWRPSRVLLRRPIGITVRRDGVEQYLFRFADFDWRADRPASAAWYANFAASPAMRATAPLA